MLFPRVSSASRGRGGGGGSAALALVRGKCPAVARDYPGPEAGTGRDRDRPKLLPTYVPQEGASTEGREATEQPRAGENQPQPCPCPVCSAWVLGRGPGKGEEAAGRTHGAWCRPLLSWRGSKANILQGCYFPCSAHAQFKRPLCSSKRASGLLFLMHTVKGKKITVIHLLRACWHQTFFSPSIREDQPFFRGEHQLVTPRTATASWCAGPRRRAGTRHRAIWASSTQIFGFGEPRSVSPGPGGK